jgi:hypothetical protein
MMAATVSTRERRNYWISLALLAIVLPATILISSGNGLLDLLRAATSKPIIVPSGATQDHAGAGWRLTALSRLPGTVSGSAVVLAEFEAVVEDPARLRESIPCNAALSDDQGRRWQPVFLSASIVRETRPDAAGKPSCGNFEGSTAGGTIAMAESFVVPQDTQDLKFSISMAGASPEVLLFE